MHVLVAPNQLVRVGRNRVLMTETCTKNLAKGFSQRTLRKKGCSRHSPGPGMIINTSDSSSAVWKETDESKAGPSYTEGSYFRETQRAIEFLLCICMQMHMFIYMHTDVQECPCKCVGTHLETRSFLYLTDLVEGGVCFLVFCISLLF